MIQSDILWGDMSGAVTIKFIDTIIIIIIHLHSLFGRVVLLT